MSVRTQAANTSYASHKLRDHPYTYICIYTRIYTYTHLYAIITLHVYIYVYIYTYIKASVSRYPLILVLHGRPNPNYHLKEKDMTLSNMKCKAMAGHLRFCLNKETLHSVLFHLEHGLVFTFT